MTCLLYTSAFSSVQRTVHPTQKPVELCEYLIRTYTPVSYTHLQRDQTLPSELAALLELEVEDIKHQGGRLKNVAEGDIGKR